MIQGKQIMHETFEDCVLGEQGLWLATLGAIAKLWYLFTFQPKLGLNCWALFLIFAFSLMMMTKLIVVKSEKESKSEEK